MFQSLRVNQQLFILRKENVPYLETASILSVSGVKMAQPQVGQMPSYTVDMTVKIGDRTENFTVPANSTYATTNNGLCSIAISKDDIDNEIDSMYQRSVDAINPTAIEYHNNVISACKMIKQQLHPEMAEKEQQQQRVQALEQQMQQMSSHVADLMAMNKALLEQLSHQNEKPSVNNKPKN